MDFKKLINDNRQNVKNIIHHITKEDNEDLEQDVYVKVLKNVDKYREQGSLKSWISKIARNVSLDYLKSSYRKNYQNGDSDEYTLVNIKDTKLKPEDNVINLERQMKIRNAIENLKPKFK